MGVVVAASTCSTAAEIVIVVLSVISLVAMPRYVTKMTANHLLRHRSREGEWENGRYRPQSSLNLNSSASQRSGQKKSVRSRSTSRDKRHRRRPACSAEYCH